MKPRSPVVISRPDAVAAAMRRNGLSTRDIEQSTGVSRSTVSNVASKADYGITKAKAAAIAVAIGEPVGALFVHRDGAPLT